MKLIEFNTDKPFIHLKESGGVPIPQDIIKTKDSFVDFFETLYGLEDNMKKIKDDMETVLKDVEDNVTKWPEDFMAKVDNNPLKL